MSLQSIQNYCHQENFAGNTHIECVPIDWIENYPEFTKDGHNFSTSIDLKFGKEWLLFPCVPETLDFQERERIGSHGVSDTPTISGFLPGDTPKIAEVLNSAFANQWVVILYYKTGEAKVIGSPDYPARFLSSLNNRGNLNSGKGYDIEFFSEGNFKSFFLEGNLPVPSGPCAPASVANAVNSPTYTDTVASGSVLYLPKEQITVNGDLLVTKNSVEDYNVNVVDANGVIVPITISYEKVMIPSLPAPKILDVVTPYDKDLYFANTEVVTLSSGIITSINSSGLTGYSLRKNGSIVTAPFSIANGDILLHQFNKSLSKGVIILNGSYV